METAPDRRKPDSGLSIWLRKSGKTALIFLLILTPLFLDAAYTWRRAPRIPFRDQLLASMRIAVKAADGEIGIGDLWKQHNEHRIFFTRLVTAVLARWAHWDLRLQAALSILMAAMMLILSGILLGFPGKPGSAALMAITAWLLLPLRLWAIWQNSFLNQHLFAVLFLLAALVSLKLIIQAWIAVVAAAFWCFCATISVGTGLLSWVAVAALLFLKRDRRLKEIVLWTILAGIGISLYFHHFSLGGHDPTEGTLMHKLAYFLTFLGNSFVDTMSTDYRPATLAGALGVGLWTMAWAGLFLRKKIDPDTLLFFPLGLFALGSAFLATLSRSYIGCIQALFSHYVLYSSLLWISLIGAVFRLWSGLEGAHRRRMPALVGIVVVLPLAGLYLQANWKAWNSPSFVSPAMEKCFRQYPDTGDSGCLVGLHEIFEPGSPDAGRRKNILRRIRQLKKRGLTVFYDQGGSDSGG